MRHVNQGHEIEVSLPGDVDAVTPDAAREAFERTYESLFDRETLPYPVEVLTYRLELREAHDRGEVRLSTPGTDRRPEARTVRFGAETHEADVYRWPTLDPGTAIEGPAIVEAGQTTVVVDPAATATIGETRDVTIDL